MSISASSGFGFLGLYAYSLTLLPTCVKAIFPQSGKITVISWLKKYRRNIGISVFLLSLLHGGTWLYISRTEIFQWQFISQCWHGLSALTIFGILALTSNNWSVKVMKRRWKQLHKLTYLALLILTVHIWEKTAYKLSLLAPYSRGILVFIVLCVVFRFSIQWYKHKGDRKVNVNGMEVND